MIVHTMGGVVLSWSHDHDLTWSALLPFNDVLSFFLFRFFLFYTTVVCVLVSVRSTSYYHVFVVRVVDLFVVRVADLEGSEKKMDT